MHSDLPLLMDSGRPGRLLVPESRTQSRQSRLLLVQEPLLLLQLLLLLLKLVRHLTNEQALLLLQLLLLLQQLLQNELARCSWFHACDLQILAIAARLSQHSYGL